MKSDESASNGSELRRAGWRWPTDFKVFMGWVFLVTTLQYVTILVRAIPYELHQQYPVPLVRRMLIAPAFPLVVAAISGAAWWTVWKQKPSARIWAIAASLIYILIFARQFIILLQEPWYQHVGALFIGIVGLGTFLPYDWKGST